MRSYVETKQALAVDRRVQIRQELGNAARVPIPKSIWNQNSQIAVDSTVKSDELAQNCWIRQSQTLPNTENLGDRTGLFESEYTESTVNTGKLYELEDQLKDDRCSRQSLQNPAADVNADANTELESTPFDFSRDDILQFDNEQSYEDDSEGDEDLDHFRENEILKNELASMNGMPRDHVSRNKELFCVFGENESYPTTTSGHIQHDAETEEVAARQAPTDAGIQLVQAETYDNRIISNRHMMPQPNYEPYRQQHIHELVEQYHSRQPKLQAGRQCDRQHSSHPSAQSIDPQDNNAAKIYPYLKNSKDKTKSIAKSFESTNAVLLSENLPSRPTSTPHMYSQSMDSPFDYELPTLLTMNFHTLLDESFDNDPGSQLQPGLPHDQKSSSLSVRLEDVSNLNHLEQNEFFSSLPIDKWEIAGDWFQEQFSILVSRMKQLRQEQRAIAKSFEKTVADRYEGVKKEEELLGRAMEKMKANGGLVLQDSTPKRKRQ